VVLTVNFMWIDEKNLGKMTGYWMKMIDILKFGIMYLWNFIKIKIELLLHCQLKM